jgi:hypothetical protein
LTFFNPKIASSEITQYMGFSAQMNGDIAISEVSTISQIRLVYPLSNVARTATQTIATWIANPG